MNKVLNTRPPGWFWAVSTILLLWNLIGVYAYLNHVRMTEAEMNQAYGEALAALHAATPWWATGAFAVAVFAGSLGALGLLIRKAWAQWLMIGSLAAVAVQECWAILFSGWLEFLQTTDLIMPAVTLLICIFGVWLANRGVKRGWLR